MVSDTLVYCKSKCRTLMCAVTVSNTCVCCNSKHLTRVLLQVSDVSRFLCVVWVKTPVLELSCAAVSPTCVRLVCDVSRFPCMVWVSDSHVCCEWRPLCQNVPMFLRLPHTLSHYHVLRLLTPVCAASVGLPCILWMSGFPCVLWTSDSHVWLSGLPFVLLASWLLTALWIPKCVRPDSCVCFKSGVGLPCIL